MKLGPFATKPGLDMTRQKKAPAGRGTNRGAKLGDLDNSPAVDNTIGEVFAAIAAQPIWAPYDARKRLHSGLSKLSVSEPAHWMPLADALQLVDRCALSGPHLNIEDNRLFGVSLILTGGIVLDGWRLIGIDVDKVTEQEFSQIELVGQLATYWEISPSGNGLHGYAWVPDERAQQFADTCKVNLPNCDHAEIYLGTGGRHLTVTGHHLAGSLTRLARLDEASCAVLEALLQPADGPRTAQEDLGPPVTPGTAVDLASLPGLADDERALVQGTLATGERSEPLHSILQKLFKAGHSHGDVLATATSGALWDYFTSKRADADSAFILAEKEVEKAASKVPDMAHLGEQLRQQLAIRGMEQQPMKQEAPKSRLSLVTAAKLAERAGPIAWLVRGYFEADTIFQVFGAPGSYKSFLAGGLAAAIASGQPWQGCKVLQGPVVYICGEGHNGLARRLLATCKEAGVDLVTLPLHYTDAAVSLSEEAGAAQLKELIDSLPIPPVLIIIDTLARNFGAADENSTTDMNAFIGNVDKLRGNAAVMIIHHAGHSNYERERGSSALRGALDANYRLERDNDTHGVKLVPLKMKDAELPPPLLLRPKIVTLDILDEDGNQITSVVLEKFDDPNAAQVAAFYKRYPEFAKGKQRERVIELMVKLYDKPDCSLRELGNQMGWRPNVAYELMKLLEKHGLAGKEPLRLTPKGLQAAGILALRVRPAIMLEAAQAVRARPYSAVLDETRTAPVHQRLELL